MKAAEEIDAPSSTTPELSSASETATYANTGSAVRFSAAVVGASSGLSFNNPNYGDQSNIGGAVIIPENKMAENYRGFDQTDTSPIIPEIRIRSYSFRIREVILAAVALIAFISCLALIAIVAKNSASSSSNSGGMTSAQIAVKTLCTDAPCLKSAAYAVSNMNTSINPCEDFFEYACGNFPNLHPLDPDVSQRTVFWNLYYENEDKLRTILEQAPRRDASFSAEKKLKDFFVSCIDDYGKMNAGGRVFIEKIVQPLGGWDVLNTFDPSTFNFQTNIEKTSIDFWVAALFTFRVRTDPYNRARRVIEIDMSGMGLYWRYYIVPEASQIRLDYKKFIRTVGKHLARDSGLTLDPEEVANKTELFVNDVYDIEYELANITWHTLPTEDPHHPDKKISLYDLTTSTNNVIDFVHFFQTMFGSANVNGNTKVTLREDDWLRRVLTMVENMPATNKERKLQNYFVWRLAQSYATEMSWDYIHASRNFHVDQNGITGFLGTNKHCSKIAGQKFADVMGSIYAMLSFQDVNKFKSEEIVKYVRETLIDRIDKIKFMDKETKDKARAKLKASTDKMGYPDVYMDETAIDAIYEHIHINRSDYFQNLLNLNIFDKEDWTRRLTQGEDRSRWFFNSYDTTMYFYNRWNQLLIPAGMLQFPIYEWTLPHYYNFGGMGGLVGHYLVHAIDSWGSTYDAEGTYGSWYTNVTKQKYEKVKQCYGAVFSNKTMGPYSVVGQTQQVTIPIQGMRFAWEGLAETSGIRTAYYAYKKWLQDKGGEKLTPTPHYTNDQSFFLTYAQLGCHVRTEQLKYNYAQRQRVPENIRINVAFSMLEEFTTAFKCPANSPMNSQTKCDTF